MRRYNNDMDGALDILNYFFVFVLSTIAVHAVPPEACFANFRWDDCGHPPTPVMYYWKPGSRCEVGIWRGCLPNLNMFHDEYECINTCIFVDRAQPEDYHDHFKIPKEYEEITANMTIEIEANVTADANGTQSQNETVTTDAGGNGTDTGGANGTNSETTVGGGAAEGGETTTGGDAPANSPDE